MLISMRSSLDPCCVAGALLQGHSPIACPLTEAPSLLNFCLLWKKQSTFCEIESQQTRQPGIKSVGRKDRRCLGPPDELYSCWWWYTQEQQGSSFRLRFAGGRLRHSLAAAASRVLTVKSDESGSTEASSRPVHLRRSTPTHSGVHTSAPEKTTNSMRVAVL